MGQMMSEAFMPGTPICVEKTSSSLLLTWTPPQIEEFQNYEIKYRMLHEKIWQTASTQGKETTFLLTKLRCNTGYQFRIRVSTDSGDDGRLSKVSDEIWTEESLLKPFQDKAIRLAATTPQTYQIPVQTELGQNPSAKFRKCTLLNDEPNRTKHQKTIMLVGPTGSGKSTLIEGMLNYILGVSWDDNSRFKLDDLKEDEKQKQNDQTISQTDWITSYCLNWTKGFQIDFNLNIIDTPGFDDASGIERGRKLVDQIRTFLTSSGDKGINELNAICFVVKSTEVRLTPTMRYVFDSILALFGKDVEKNIHVLLTFADGDEPRALNALEAAEVPFQQSFVFNNSALFVDPAKSPNGHFFWKMGKSCFNKFFTTLKSMDARSLRFTSEVLLKRRQLENDISNIQQQIRLGTAMLADIRQEELILDQFGREVTANKNFKTKIKKTKITKASLPAGKHTTTCLICNRTCHENCAIAEDEKKHLCSAMTNGYCNECEKKCYWKEHKNVPYIIVYETVEENVTLKQLQEKYLEANDQLGTKTLLLDKIKRAFKELRDENLQLVRNVRECIRELEKIELRGNPLSSAEYIKLLIQVERSEKKPGHEERKDMLLEMLKEATAMETIVKGEFKFPK